MRWPWKSFRRIATAAVLTLLAGCSPFAILNATAPQNHYAVKRDIAYGELERQRLDVYTPRSQSGQAPVVVFLYGGSWESGERGEYAFIAEALTSLGFVAVIPDYRVYPEVKFPTFLEDCARAVKWAKDHIGEHGGDAKLIYVMGHSAGAYNAAMLAFDKQYLEAVGMSPKMLRGFIGLAGPYDFLPLKKPALIDIFGGKDNIPHTQPINFVTRDAPPALLLVGNTDTTVKPGNTTRLAARIREKSGEVREVVYDGIGHFRILGALSAPFRGWAPVLRDVAQFINSTSVQPVTGKPAAASQVN
ncbi:MAG TPA: alpha/beta hydrolase [Burkholderiales bacterium]|nr:alpha/beta hydrolase [Burkholderiales bacterium]